MSLTASAAVHHGRHHGAERRRVADQLVRDQPSGLTAFPFQQPAEKALGRAPVAPGLHEEVDHVAVLVDRRPQILLPPLNVDEQFVQVLRVAQGYAQLGIPHYWIVDPDALRIAFDSAEGPSYVVAAEAEGDTTVEAPGWPV